MADTKRAGAAALFASFALVAGFLLATAYMNYRLNGHLETIDFLLLPVHAAAIREHLPRDFMACLALILAPPLLALVLSTAVKNETLTAFGTTRWQTPREMKRDGFREDPGFGFILGKLGSPKSRADFLCSTAFPHVYLTGPTGSGKGVSFVVPNLLACKGSSVTLDSKGENFIKTSRRRRRRGDTVIRFAPGDFSGRGSHRYNPLARLAAIANPDERMMELREAASLFLDAGNSGAESFLQGGIDIFVACGMLAIQNGTPTLGAIHDLATGGGDKNAHYRDLASLVRHEATARMFTNLSSINDKTLTSYLSLLLTSGLTVWSNPAIQALTAVSDFSFSDVRRRCHAIYFDVPFSKIRMFAPLIRLFFADLIATLQHHEPGPDEPFPVLIMLDEFEQLGRMPTVVNAIKTLRSYRGHLAIISQTIPGVDAIYGQDTRLTLQGGAGLQLYYAPSDRKTAEEISHALGRTTKRVIGKSSPFGLAPLKSRSLSERHEDAPLMTEDEVRAMHKDDVLIIATGHNPIRATRVVYYEDRDLAPLFQNQPGKHPYPVTVETAPGPPKAAPEDPNEPPQGSRGGPGPAPVSPPPPGSGGPVSNPVPADPPDPPAAAPHSPSPSPQPGPAEAAPMDPARPASRGRPPRAARPQSFLQPDAKLIAPHQLDSLRAGQTRMRGATLPEPPASAPSPALRRARAARFAPVQLRVISEEDAQAVRAVNGVIVTLSATLSAKAPDAAPSGARSART